VRQFVLPADWDGGSACEVTGRDAKRLSTVLRLGRGDSFPAIGPDGATYRCSVLDAGKDRVALSVAPERTGGGAYKPDVRAGRGLPATPTLATPTLATPTMATVPRLTLAVGMLKGSKLDEVVRAATEAGVATIVPLATARSVPKEHSGGRVERLRRVASEALGQSGSPVPTRIADPSTVAELCAALRPSRGIRLGLFFHESPLAQASLHRYCTDVPDEIVACVGPEGGFDPDEILTLTEAGFSPAWLGATVLRAETAAIFAVAALRVICLERSSWSTTELEE